MDWLIERLRVISRYGAWFGGVLIFVAAVIVAVEVLIRKFFNLTIGGADELSGFALAISSAFAFGYALLERSHVRIDSIYSLMPSPLRAILDMVGLIVFILFMGLFAWHATGVFTDSVNMDARTMTVLETPLRYPQFFWIAGLYLFVVIALALLLRAVLTLFRGDFASVQLQIGSKNVSEELDEELEQLEKRGGHHAGPPDESSLGGPDR